MRLCTRKGQLRQLCTQNTGDGGVQRPHVGVFRATPTPPSTPRCPGSREAAGRWGGPPGRGPAAAGGSARCPVGVGGGGPACPHLCGGWVPAACLSPGGISGPTLTSGWPQSRAPNHVRVLRSRPSAASCRHAGAKRAILCPPSPPLLLCPAGAEGRGWVPAASGDIEGGGVSAAPLCPHGATSPTPQHPCHPRGRPPGACPGRRSGGEGGACHLLPTFVKPETVKLIKALQQQD